MSKPSHSEPQPLVDDGRAGISTRPIADEPQAPRGLGAIGWARWTWRTLTSMRTALILLLLLAVGSIPGSVFPQRLQKPIEVNQYLRDNPAWGKILDRLGMFDVFASPWFAAIYVLLFVSLAGCVLPRTMVHARALRLRPPAAPRALSRMPEHRSLRAALPEQEVLDAAAARLRSQRWRVDTSPYDGATGWVSAEKGYARETGNLLFHVALLCVLASVAMGSLFGFSGKVVIREGTGFANTVSQYDSFTPGRFTDSADLPPFSVTLDDFRATYQRGGQQDGAPRDFEATVTTRATPDDAPQTSVIAVNSPLEIGGVKMFLVGHGYAPQFTVKDKAGQIVFKDSVVFLPQDGKFTSTGVVKVPDTSPQLALKGFFLPTAKVDAVRGPYSGFPGPDNPAAVLAAWSGDLGLDTGVPKSVYSLDTTSLTRLGIKAMLPGQTWTIPQTGQSVTFDGYTEFASFSVARDPGKELALGAAMLAIAGLVLSLLVQRRRIWVRVSSESTTRTVVSGSDVLVEVAGLTRSEHASVAEEVDGLVEFLLASGAIRGATVAPAQQGTREEGMHEEQAQEGTVR